MKSISSIHESRIAYSKRRLDELRRGLAKLSELTSYPDVTIFGAGSYARLEASEYSDIDLFFLNTRSKGSVTEPRMKSLRLFGKIIDIADQMGLPKFSNDCEYLVILPADEMLTKLGGRTDDHENFFTARMLLLLESHCLYGEDVFDSITKNIISSYFRDYPDHGQTFRPSFLLNDICRFWKTLLLNYENKRNVPETESEERQIRQKVRNFKLKYSRMTTCFASIAALGSRVAPMTEEKVLEMTKLTPLQRLQSIDIPQAQKAVRDVLDKYAWFLEMTGLPTSDLEAHFVDKQQRIEMFENAAQYGDAMFKLLSAIDRSDQRLRLLRNLVI